MPLWAFWAVSFFRPARLRGNIIQPVFAAFTDEELLAKANDICRRGNKKVAERVSRRELPDLQGTEYLFLCLDKPSG